MVSREKPIEYALMAQLLINERERGGTTIWVTGPALVHSRARSDMVWFIRHGFVGTLSAGNAVAVHDIEASIYRHDAGDERSRDGNDGRSWAAHAGHQQSASRGLDRCSRSQRLDHRRHHACLHRGATCRSCSPDRFVTTGRCPM